MSQFLEQGEVDALLNGLSDGEIKTEKPSPSPSVSKAEADSSTDDEVRVYDLTSPEHVVGGRLPRLESTNQKMARQLRAAFSGALRRVVDVNARPIQTMKYSEFMKTLPMPTSMHVFRMMPLRGGAMVALEPKLVFALIESFLGGTGVANIRIDGRDFTPIESRIILRIVDIVFEEMERAWEPIEPITVEHERTEINPQFVGIVAPSDVVFISPFEVEMDEVSGLIRLCIPYSTIEPIREKLYVGFENEHLVTDTRSLRRLLRHLDTIEIEASVELGSTEIVMETLLQLQVGDVVRLDQNCDDELLVKIEGEPKFTGLPCRIKQTKALQIVNRIVPPEEEQEDARHE